MGSREGGHHCLDLYHSPVACLAEEEGTGGHPRGYLYSPRCSAEGSWHLGGAGEGHTEASRGRYWFLEVGVGRGRCQACDRSAVTGRDTVSWG